MNDHEIIEWIAEHLSGLTCHMSGSITITWVDDEGYHQVHTENQLTDENESSTVLLKRAIIKLNQT